MRSNREHLVGRKFVPQGLLGPADFNFIFRACTSCNTRKSNAERHLSTVTLYTSESRAESPTLNELAEHKAGRDIHPTKRVPVKDSWTEHEFKYQLFGANWTLAAQSPPQPDRQMIALLACNHIQALFALITSSDPRDPSSLRLLPASQWHLFGYFPASDWGNSQLIEIAGRTRAWPTYASIETASGHFRAILRHAPDERRGWMWALEWNRALRVIGGIADRANEHPAFSGLPELKWDQLPDGASRIRRNIPLGDQPDELFVCERLGE